MENCFNEGINELRWNKLYSIHDENRRGVVMEMMIGSEGPARPWQRILEIHARRALT